MKLQLIVIVILLFSSNLYAAKLHKSSQRLPNLSQPKFPIPLESYDLIVLGAGIGGETTAITASKFGKKVAIVEQKNVFGGPSGLTSKAFRLAASTICSLCNSEANIRYNSLFMHSLMLIYCLSCSIRKNKIKELWKRMFPALKAEAQVLQAADSRKRFDGTHLHVLALAYSLTNSLTRSCR